MAQPFKRATTFKATNSHQLSIVILPVIMAFLATITVVLRFRARRVQKQKYRVDDWFALSALILTWVFQAVNMAAVFAGGAGLPLETVMAIDPEALYTYLKIVVANFTLWIVTVSVVQLSILFFYIRIFHVNKLFIWMNYALIFAVVAFGIYGFCSEMFGCRPISKAWDPTTPGTCIDSQKSCSAVGIIHVLLDLAIVIIPMPLIWKLKLPIRSKLVLSVLLCLGLIATIISLLKIVCVFDLTGIPQSDVTDWLWLTILLQTLELPIGIICCCVPSLRPALTEIGPIFNSLTSRLRSLTGGSSQLTNDSQGVWVEPGSRGNDSTSGFVRFNSSFASGGQNNLGHNADVTGYEMELGQQNKMPGGVQAINVSNGYAVSRE